MHTKTKQTSKWVEMQLKPYVPRIIFLNNKNVSPKMNGKFIFEELSMQNTK
jgi:hypothetical protein